VIKINKNKLNNDEKICEECYINQFGLCQRSSVSINIISDCRSYDMMERAQFANKNGLLSKKIEEIFAELFWEFHNLNGLILNLELIRKVFNEPSKIFSDVSEQIVKDNLFIEILMKFCKIAEDLGAILYSKSEDPYEFTKEYITYTIRNVVDFYSKITDNKAKIEELFYYPPIDKQDNDKAKNIIHFSLIELKGDLRIIAETYVKYKEIYNSYKHGYRVRFKEVDQYIWIRDDIKYYPKVILYYEKRMIKKFPGAMSMMGFKKFDDSNFNAVYELCISALQIIKLFIHNYKQFHKEGNEKSIALFFDPTFTTDDYIQDLKNELKEYTFKY